LAALHARGRAAHPDLLLDHDRFAAHLSRFAADKLTEADALEAPDLYLACAAVAGVPAAVDKLRRVYWPIIVHFLRPLRMSKAFREEFAQDLWEALLVGRPSAPPKLAMYSGRGPLAGFLGVTARRMALSALRHRGAEERAAVRGIARAEPPVNRDAELAIIKDRYRQAFQKAIEDALRVLDERARDVLRMHVADGLTVDRIAKVYDVSQSTVSRWIAAARKAILAEARRLLREHLPLSDGEFESLTNLLASEVELSLSKVSLRKR
jgi:RNA polymerase sigma-70 factor (ECF subfamily)